MYFIEVMSTFLLFLFIGAFFSPLFGGCFTVMLLLTIMSGLIIFFSLNFVWFLALGGVVYILGFLHKYLRYRKLLDINQYLSTHPECKLDVGVACYSCHSSNLTNHGLFGNRSRLRYYTCAQCGTTLFRFRVL